MRDKKIKQKPNRTQILWFFGDFKHDVFCISELLRNQQQKNQWGWGFRYLGTIFKDIGEKPSL